MGVAAPTAVWRAIAWNNLGMHCMDADFSVFSILPPYNNLYAQVVDPAGHLITNPAGVNVTYEAVADPDGSYNATSIGKTNFWQNVQALFGVPLAQDVGLAGNAMPGAGNTAAGDDLRRRAQRFRGRRHPDHAVRRRAWKEPVSHDARGRPGCERSPAGEHQRRSSGFG